MEGTSQNVEPTSFNKHRPLEDYYPMTQKKIGKVYIFNQITFNEGGLQTKYAIIKDCYDIQEVFQSLKFDVKCYSDLSYKDILKKQLKIANANFSNYGCLIIFVLTHGRNGKLCAADTDYYPDVYWNSFNKSSTLIHKPKLIFIQAPSDEADEDLRMQPVRAVPKTYFIPEVPDVLLMYSCFDMFISWRSLVTGSSFIQCLCKEFQERAENTDALTILTFINRAMSLDFAKSLNGTGKGSRNAVITVSTLNKMLYFGSINK
ncbi:hypothetical protein RN001_014533 [Aquatica leii]|uniref:Caspase family p20 domain-containing protein n=1 Tax=Aquatica leii TaxID=1421715 RepID=A0AAN7SBP4_9COLE|nr:hypothetical protein RN001_014533 [Aquatica leii]